MAYQALFQMESRQKTKMQIRSAITQEHTARVVAAGVWGAPGVGVAQEVGRAAALGSVVDGLTVGALPTGSPGAGVLTPVGDPVTFLGGPALCVPFALVTAARQRVPNIGVLALADWSVVRANLDKVVKVSPRKSKIYPGFMPLACL